MLSPPTPILDPGFPFDFSVHVHFGGNQKNTNFSPTAVSVLITLAHALGNVGFFFLVCVGGFFLFLFESFLFILYSGETTGPFVQMPPFFFPFALNALPSPPKPAPGAYSVAVFRFEHCVLLRIGAAPDLGFAQKRAAVFEY